MKSKLREISHFQTHSGGFASSHSYHPAAVPRSANASKFWLKWVFVSALGGLGGEVLALSIGTEASPLAFIIVSSIVASSQYLILEKYLLLSRWWVPLTSVAAGISAIYMRFVGLVVASVIGEALTWAAALHLIRISTQAADFIGMLGMLTALVIASLGAGTLVGTCQWFVLRNKIPNASRWIVANAVAFLIAAIITAITPLMMPVDANTSALLNTGLNTGITAAVTGAVLIKLLEFRN